ncbi:MAG: glycoside hydrolase family 3 C-terminal domain-containing protein [Clostridia bacterium]|nr:glycoside hydrolase family 3 C-terminal domain-containing protein [Clostridia bacterium]
MMKLKKLFTRAVSILITGVMALIPLCSNVTAVRAADIRQSMDFPNIYPAENFEKISDSEIEQKVKALLKTMTRDEMYAMLGGSTTGNKKGYGTAYVGGVPRLGVPVLRMWDGPQGVISEGNYETTCPASEISLASSFSKELAYKYGQVSGSDNKATAGNVQLGSQIDHVRSPLFMRSRDSLGEDPYLTSVLGEELAAGIQNENVMATLKHLAVYCNMFTSNSDNVTVDEQTLHQLYLAPYERIIKAGKASAVMSSYNLINGTQASANTYLQIEVLRKMWGYKGLTMTDWGGNKKLTTHLGSDLETETLTHNTKKNIEKAIKAGTMTWQDVENAVRHTLTAMGQIGYLGLVKVNEDGTAAADPVPPASIELNVLEGQDRIKLLERNDEIALESAVKGAVLLKNDKNALPVKQNERIAMIGLGSQYSVTGHYREASFGWLQSMTSPYENMLDILGKNASITSEIGLDIVGTPIPEEYLFVDESTSKQGVEFLKNNDESSKKTLDSVEITIGTMNGKVNRTYKNTDGNAGKNGESVTMTTFLKAPESGTYGFKLLGIGGTGSVVIKDGDRQVAKFDASNTSGWGKNSVVHTAEGMDIPSYTKDAYLTKDRIYKVVVTGKGTSAAKDLQLRLTWFVPGQRASDYARAVQAAKNNDTVILFVHDTSIGTFGFFDIMERKTLGLPADQSQLLKDVIAAAKPLGHKVIVVMNIGLPVTMDWIDDVDAVLNMWLPGQAGGKATAQLLTGVKNPGGKLPVTFPKNENDTQFGELSKNHTPEKINNVSEGIFSGYRWYDKNGVTPLFPFGHGLSYTTFAYSDLSIKKTPGVECGYDVTFTVKNTGQTTGTEVAQVYLGKAEVPKGIQMAEKQLAGFARIEELKPGESISVTVQIDQKALSYWNPNVKLQVRADGTKDKWVVADPADNGGRYILVGSSSRDIRLTGQTYGTIKTSKP